MSPSLTTKLIIEQMSTVWTQLQSNYFNRTQLRSASVQPIFAKPIFRHLTIFAWLYVLMNWLTLIPMLKHCSATILIVPNLDLLHFSQSLLVDAYFSGYLTIGPRYTWGPIYGSRCPSVRSWCFFNLIDVTLVDGDINPIPTDEAKRAILGNVAMQVAPPDDQIRN